MPTIQSVTDVSVCLTSVRPYLEKKQQQKNKL